MGGLFAVGSLLFALGSLPLYFDNIDPGVVAATFFAGSLFFTAAALVQFQESRSSPAAMFDPATADPAPADPVPAKPALVNPALVNPAGHRRLPVISPGRIDWWASAIQLAGTLLFNVSTFAATRQDLSTDQARRLIWSPDVLGSVCFLVASWLAYSEVNVGVRPRPDRSMGWRIAALNMFGSIAFGVSAVAARYLRTTGEMANVALVNGATFVGAVCFCIGAVLLPVESARDRVVP